MAAAGRGQAAAVTDGGTGGGGVVVGGGGWRLVAWGIACTP